MVHKLTRKFFFFNFQGPGVFLDVVSEVNEYERILEGEELQRTVYKGWSQESDLKDAVLIMAWFSHCQDSRTCKHDFKSAMAFQKKQTNKQTFIMFVLPLCHHYLLHV